MISINYKYDYVFVMLCTFNIYTNKLYNCYVIYLVLFCIILDTLTG